MSDFELAGCLIGEMQDKSDVQLLRDFDRNGDDAAFREIVRRYTDLVYSAALRQVESPAAAADIAQSVFTDLARKVGALARNAKPAPANSLAGWLHRATRYAALNHLREARRRLTNERQAMEQLRTNSESGADWEQMRPMLDEALDGLGDEDREALLLRYFKNQDFRAVGLALGVSDDAAQKRVSRAVERLREFFSKRNVTIGAGGLVVLISTNAVQSAPVGLAAAISAAALLTGKAVTTSSAVAITKTIAMTTLQKTLVAAAVAVLAGAGIYEARQAAQMREQNKMLQQQQVSLASQVQQMQGERDEANAKLATLQNVNESLRTNLAAFTKPRSPKKTAGITLQQAPSDNPISTDSKTKSIEIPKGSWADAGFATPEAALRTRGWTVLTGNRDRFAESLSITPGARKILEDMFVQMAAASTDPDRDRLIQEVLKNKWGVEEGILMPMMALNQQQGFTGYHILSEQPLSADQMMVEVETEMASAPPHRDTLKFQLIGNDWKVVIDEDSLKSMR